MKRLPVVATVVWSLVLFGLCSDVGAARGCRPSRRCCVGVTHQPCTTAAVRAPKCQSAVTEIDDCICAFYMFMGMGGVNYYYGVDFPPDCSTGIPTMVVGRFDTSNPNPCPTCPSSQCVVVPHYTSLNPAARRYFKPGTKLDQKLQWDEKLVLKSGQGKIQRAGAVGTYEFEAKELADARMLVSFTSGNTLYFAKLHVCRIESQELAGNNKTATVTDFAVGQEIDAPPADQKILDVTKQVTILDANNAEIRVGNTTYRIVTATTLSE